jgi:hypothetical protein
MNLECMAVVHKGTSTHVSVGPQHPVPSVRGGNVPLEHTPVVKEITTWGRPSSGWGLACHATFVASMSLYSKAYRMLLERMPV